MRDAAPTPVRSACEPRSDGLRHLADRGVAYLDGSEERVLELVRSAADITSLSDELEERATSWPEHYHLAKSRANFLRAFNLDASMRVLEVGAGCGVITRYVGEQCGLVDALEPVEARARVAAMRTRDLDSVAVFVGGLEDVPREPAYDVVLIVGVLEYVGSGRPGHSPYVDFLTEAAARLRPGGRILCAIENRLGVKYLAGAPEDHTGRVFDGIEGYPRASGPRTFTRSELGDLFATAGLKPAFFHAFPDYKMSRAVWSDELFTAEPSLARRLPRFPSAERGVERPHLADERSLWEALVADGTGSRFSNSFVVEAGPSGNNTLWPDDRLASVYTTERRALWATETSVVQRAGAPLRFERKRLAGRERRVESGPLALDVTDADFVEGEDLPDVLARAADDEIRSALARWRRLVEPGALDLVPHNLVVTPNGNLAVIDQEWSHSGYTAEAVVERGIVILASGLAERTLPGRWDGRTVRDVVRTLSTLAGLPSSDGWIDRRLGQEAVLQSEIYGATPAWMTRGTPDEHLSGLAALLDRPLDELPLGRRAFERPPPPPMTAARHLRAAVAQSPAGPALRRILRRGRPD